MLRKPWDFGVPPFETTVFRCNQHHLGKRQSGAGLLFACMKSQMHDLVVQPGIYMAMGQTRGTY